MLRTYQQIKRRKSRVIKVGNVSIGGNNQIAVQTARSKSGPGGAMNDSIAFNKSFQQCLAKQTKLKGKCG
mgnify:CR=1 FL=1